MILALACAAVLCLLVSLRRFRRGKIRRGIFLLFLALLFTLLAVFYYRISLNLAGYDLILDERDIVEVSIGQGDRTGRVRIRDMVNRRAYSWEAKGASWHLVLREFRLTGRCERLGWPPVYRLTSIEALESSEEGQKPVLHDVELHHSSQGTDLWRQIRRLLKARPHLGPQLRSCVLADRRVSESFDFSPGVYRFSFSRGELKVRNLAAPED